MNVVRLLNIRETKKQLSTQKYKMSLKMILFTVATENTEYLGMNKKKDRKLNYRIPNRTIF